MSILASYPRQLCLLIIFAALPIFVVKAQSPAAQSESVKKPVEYYGKLDADPIPDAAKLYGILFEPVGDISRFKLAKSPDNDSHLTAGKIYDERVSGGKFELLLVEPKNAIPRLCSDLNADGKIEETECLELKPTGKASVFYQLLKLPLKNSFYQYYPVYLQFEQGAAYRGLKPEQRVVFQTVGAFAVGDVKIDERQVRVQYRFNPTKTLISTTDGLFGIDVDGDRSIRNEPFSPESSYAAEEEIVFKLGARYLSTSRIDLEKNQIVMRERSAAEYRRRDLETGRELADFAFTDFEGKPRSLKEFRGKYLLIDFWGMWCVDCRREIPFQTEAVRRFKVRGFEILGLDSDEADKFEEVKAFLAANKMNWTQARFESVKELIEKQFRIQEYPSAILLDPNGKVLVLDQKQLTGKNLLETLDRVLPKE